MSRRAATIYWEWLCLGGLRCLPYLRQVLPLLCWKAMGQQRIEWLYLPRGLNVQLLGRHVLRFRSFHNSTVDESAFMCHVSPSETGIDVPIVLGIEEFFDALFVGGCWQRLKRREESLQLIAHVSEDVSELFEKISLCSINLFHMLAKHIAQLSL